jgi:hypothetical protein
VYKGIITIDLKHFRPLSRIKVFLDWHREKTLIASFPEHDRRHLVETGAFPEMTIVISRKPVLSWK